jgi:hypothetical protein
MIITDAVADLHGMPGFALTFPRRRRNLDYEIDTITNFFDNQLQYAGYPSLW